MAVRVKFMSAVMRMQDVAARHAGGCAASETQHPASVDDATLYCQVTMSLDDLEDWLDELDLEGFDSGTFAAVVRPPAAS